MYVRAICQACGWWKFVEHELPHVCEHCDAPFFFYQRREGDIPREERPVTHGPLLVVICLHCEASFRIRRGDLMEKCPMCLGHGSWRVALDGEITKSDRRFLKSLRISPDMERTGEP